MSADSWTTGRVFVCESCGEHISSWGDPQDTRKVCQLCRWLDDNKYLTTDERETLRKKFRGSDRGSDDQNPQSR
jgi:hypothetical protein